MTIQLMLLLFVPRWNFFSYKERLKADSSRFSEIISGTYPVLNFEVFILFFKVILSRWLLLLLSSFQLFKV